MSLPICSECGQRADDEDAGIAKTGKLVCGDCAYQDISIDRDLDVNEPVYT
jgi:formylmethanofuran dehydrogenase subunit E